MEKTQKRMSSKELKKKIERLERQRAQLTKKIEEYRELATIRYIEEVMPIVKYHYDEETKGQARR